MDNEPLEISYSYTQDFFRDVVWVTILLNVAKLKLNFVLKTFLEASNFFLTVIFAF